MKKQYLYGFLALSLFLWSSSKAEAQTVVVPQSVTANITPFSSSSTPVSNLSLNITSSVNSNTTFPYSPSSNFSTGIGFVSSLGKDTGTITYTFGTPVSISQMMIWNGYFNFELNHCSKNVDLIFRNNTGAVISTSNLALPQATSSDLKPYVANLTSEVVGVKSVQIKVKTLWGGNELSIRRIAFAGNGQTAGLMENNPDQTIQLFPNPAKNNLAILESGIQDVQLFDLNGKSIAIELVHLEGHSKIHWENTTPGVYNLQIISSKGSFFSRILID